MFAAATNLPRPCPYGPCSPVLEAALCCAIDAEWPPEETTAERRSGGLPHASLLQLALALPASCTLPSAVETACCGRGTPVLSGGCCVLLLDMMLLPPSAVKPALQQLFRCVHRTCSSPPQCAA